jgi:hypothetical protein
MQIDTYSYIISTYFTPGDSVILDDRHGSINAFTMTVHETSPKLRCSDIPWRDDRKSVVIATRR